ncbi:MAG: hypothetical protein HN566_02975, partial [Polaribacter sp.]|nr:hypothetical protein [Polaribacter sp.]
KKLLGIIILFLTCINVSLANTSLPKCTGTDDTKFKNCYGEYIKKKLNTEWSRTFKGEFGNTAGVRHGYGSSTMYKNNVFFRKFEGDFKNDRSIYGKEEWHNGLRFEGEYKDGRWSFGEIGYPNQPTNKYFGSFINGRPSGFARITNHGTGFSWYLGETKEQHPHGLGFMFLEKDNLPAALLFDDSKTGKNSIKAINQNQLTILQEKEKTFLEKELNFLVNYKVKSECQDLGFVKGSNEYSDCSLKLSILYKEQAIEEQKIKIAEQQARLAQRQTKAAESQARAAEANVKAAEATARAQQSLARDSRRRSNDALIKRGMGLINGTCTLANLSGC